MHMFFSLHLTVAVCRFGVLLLPVVFLLRFGLLRPGVVLSTVKEKPFLRLLLNHTLWRLLRACNLIRHFGHAADNNHYSFRDDDN